MTTPTPTIPEMRELLGDDINGGFVRSLCFTVWKICHHPTHEDGNSDWGSDTLPTVQEGVKRIRSLLQPVLDRLEAAEREVERLKVDVRQLKNALPDCTACGGSGHIDHDAKTTGANQHSACREVCDRCEGLGVEL